MELKRPIELPTPEAVTRIFKRPRLEQSNPLIHSVPPNIIPIINPPNTINDFFTDLQDVKNIDRVNQQIKLIIEKFPPPLPPLKSVEDTAADEDDAGGIMVPFIYPPPPIVDLDKLPYSLNNYKKKKMNKGKQSNMKYITVPPLPFPPANFMPYPLNSDVSTLPPLTVFDVLLQANGHLPRTDMLMASAAGSLTDIKLQATEEAFDFESYLNYKSRNQDAEYFDNDDYVNYLQNIDVKDYFDGYDKSVPTRNTVPEFIKVDPAPSMIRSRKSRKRRNNLSFIYDDDFYSDEEFSDEEDVEIPFNSGELLSNFKDVVSGNGNHKEKRRLELKKSLGQLELFADTNRDKIYQLKRAQLLSRLKNLQTSKLQFCNSTINDDELARYDRQIQLSRDEELLRLKLEMNYELLKASLVFYQDSNKVYKSMNAVVINKLEKLKVFFEFQQKLFTGIVSSPNSDFLDIKHKDAVKLYAGLSDHNYNQEIKAILQHSIDASGNENGDLNLSDPVHLQQDLIKLTKSILSVNDFMPLITPGEFNVITGDLPTNKPKSLSSNNKKQPAIKHQIFKSPLYDRVTSGSDSNVSDSTSATPTIKRRGRRANDSSAANLPGITNDRGDTKYTEAALLAKIMKNFLGPQGANPEEYHNDLESMGIASIWPPLR